MLIPLGHSLAQTAAPLKTDVPKEKLVAELERAIPDLMKKASIPGLTIAVVRDGKLLWTKGFGVKSTKTSEPVMEDTIFEAASLTKPFFAYAAMNGPRTATLSGSGEITGFSGTTLSAIKNKRSGLST